MEKLREQPDIHSTDGFKVFLRENIQDLSKELEDVLLAKMHNYEEEQKRKMEAGEEVAEFDKEMVLNWIDTLNARGRRERKAVYKQIAMTGANIGLTYTGLKSFIDVPRYFSQKAKIAGIDESIESILTESEEMRKNKTETVDEEGKKFYKLDGKNKGEVQEALEDLNNRLAVTKEGSQRGSEARKMIAKILRENRIKEKIQKEKRKEEVKKILDFYITAKVTGTDAIRETLNTAFLYSGSFYLRGIGYALVDAYKKTAELKRENRKNELEEIAKKELFKERENGKNELEETAKKELFKEVTLGSVKNTFKDLLGTNEKMEKMTGMQKAMTKIKAAGNILRYVGIGSTVAWRPEVIDDAIDKLSNFSIGGAIDIGAENIDDWFVGVKNIAQKLKSFVGGSEDVPLPGASTSGEAINSSSVEISNAPSFQSDGGIMNMPDASTINNTTNMGSVDEAQAGIINTPVTEHESGAAPIITDTPAVEPVAPATPQVLSHSPETIKQWEGVVDNPRTAEIFGDDFILNSKGLTEQQINQINYIVNSDHLVGLGGGQDALREAIGARFQETGSIEEALATVYKGEGVEHAIRRQLEASPEDYGFQGDVNNYDEVHRWSGQRSHQIAIDSEFVEVGGGKIIKEIRIKTPGVESFVINPEGRVGHTTGEYAHIPSDGSTAEAVSQPDVNAEQGVAVEAWQRPMNDRMKGIFSNSQGVEEWAVMQDKNASDILAGNFGEPIGHQFDMTESNNRVELLEYAREAQSIVGDPGENETIASFLETYETWKSQRVSSMISEIDGGDQYENIIDNNFVTIERFRDINGGAVDVNLLKILNNPSDSEALYNFFNEHGGFNSDLYDDLSAEIDNKGNLIISFDAKDSVRDVEMIITKNGKIAVDGIGRSNLNLDNPVSLNKDSFKEAIGFVYSGEATGSVKNIIEEPALVESAPAAPVAEPQPAPVPEPVAPAAPVAEPQPAPAPEPVAPAAPVAESQSAPAPEPVAPAAPVAEPQSAPALEQVAASASGFNELAVPENINITPGAIEILKNNNISFKNGDLFIPVPGGEDQGLSFVNYDRIEIREVDGNIEIAEYSADGKILDKVLYNTKTHKLLDSQGVEMHSSIVRPVEVARHLDSSINRLGQPIFVAPRELLVDNYTSMFSSFEQRSAALNFSRLLAGQLQDYGYAIRGGDMNAAKDMIGKINSSLIDPRYHDVINSEHVAAELERMQTGDMDNVAAGADEVPGSNIEADNAFNEMTAGAGAIEGVRDIISNNDLSYSQKISSLKEFIPDGGNVFEEGMFLFKRIGDIISVSANSAGAQWYTLTEENFNKIFANGGES